MKEINTFIKGLGNDFINFQGSGGNISMKEKGFLYIKASGYTIEDIYKKKALSQICILGFFNEYKGTKNVYEDEMSNVIEKNNISNLKSSIETGFHLLIDSKYIIHTHNIYINVLLCMIGGESILRDLFGNSIDIISYNTPGLGLYNELEKKKTLNSIILLKNHGIIVHGNKSFIDLYKKINNIAFVIKNKLGLGHFKKLNYKKNIRKHIFPDSVIINDIYIYSAHHFIKKEINKMGGNMQYLSKKEVFYIKNMKKEKYRKKIYSKNNIG